MILNHALMDFVGFIANIALALSLVVALVFGIAQVRAAERDRRERLTLDMLANYQTRDFADLMRMVSFGEIPRTNAELRAQPPEQHVLFVQLAQQMESLGILVSKGLVNVNLVDKTLGSFVTMAWAGYRPVFLEMRLSGDDPFLGEYFQWLAELMEKRMKENPRPPFYLTGAVPPKS